MRWIIARLLPLMLSEGRGLPLFDLFRTTKGSFGDGASRLARLIPGDDILKMIAVVV